ncbi:bifunctional metallophosphatase/5'-nucleotidase [Stutzerimonas kirkiae]|nr:bifunctional metallophosphatase/5'-nucleotidase [Stutzerimonas kirkiae]
MSSSNPVRPFVLLLGAAMLAAGCRYGETTPVEINVVALNDFHGNLLSSPFSYPDPQASGGEVTLKAGGIEALSGLLGELRRDDPELLLVGAGDMVGGSPPLSAMWADEPSLKALGLLGLRFSTVGNHELDHGKGELLRQLEGGCDSPRPERACQLDEHYQGSKFSYIAANLMDKASGTSLFPAYRIEQVRGAKVAFVGAVLEELDSTVSGTSMQGLYTIDEADAINAQLPELREQGVDAVIAIIHQGGETPEAFDKPDCSQLSGDVVEVVERLDPQIKVVITGHTHQGYLCRLGERLVTQGSSYGRLVTHLKLTLDPRRRQLLDVQAHNLVVDPERYSAAASPEIAELQRTLLQRSQARLDQPVARLGARTFDRTLNDAGESTLGRLIANAQLAATRSLGAQVAFMNMGGLRTDLLLEDGQDQANYGQLASIQPFNNTLTILSLSGAQLSELLEQQWQSGGLGFYPLQASSSLSYQWDDSRPHGHKIVPQSLMIEGLPVRAEGSYRVTVNSFLAEGGDNFSQLANAGERLDTGFNDLEALVGYLQERDRAGSPAGAEEARGRIHKVGASLSEGAQ